MPRPRPPTPLPTSRRAHAVVLAVLAVVGFACSCDEGGGAGDGPCARVVCRQGQDCVDGACVDRPEPDGGPGDGGTGCESNADCAFDPAGQICSLATGRCVGCLQDEHCAAGRRCVEGACRGECEGDADCGGEEPRCRPADETCVACLDEDDCESGERCEDGACVPSELACTTDDECELADPARPLCDVQAGRGLCVQCRRGADCGAGEACLGGGCVSLACAGDGDCARFPDLSRCDPAAGLCRECLADGDCAATERCTDSACQASACEDDGDCAGDPRGERCDPVSGACIACLADLDCPVPARCEQGACAAIPCTVPEDCPAGTICADGLCGFGPICAGDADCAFDPRAPYCVGTRCVGCRGNEDCPAGEACSQGACRRPEQCTSDAQCAGGYVCDRGVCSPCRTDAECPRGGCVSGFCADPAACSSDGDCAEGVCAGGTCRFCARDLDCRAGLWCEAGACVEARSCASDAGCEAGRTCAAGSCVDAGCGDDAAEPDDGPSRAAPYAVGAPVSRTLCPNDEDWLAFGAAAGAGLDAAILGAPAGFELSLVRYDPATGALHEQRAVEGRLLVASLPDAAAGRHFLRVRSADGATGSYTLLASLQPAGGPCADAFEPNDTRASPRPLAPDAAYEGLTLCGDDDFFVVDVPAGASFAAGAFFTGGAAQIELFTPSTGARLVAGTPTTALGGGAVASLGPAPAGGASYLVKVSAGVGGPPSYALLFEAGTDPACAGAADVLSGSLDRARIRGGTLALAADQAAGACGAGGPDVAYGVHLDANARLSAQLAAPWDARLALWDASCGTELSCAPFAEGLGALDVPGLPAGDYRLVVGGAPGQAGPFDLAARLSAPVPPPANDDCAAADPLELSTGAARVIGTTEGAGASLSPTCAARVPEVFYGFSLASPARVVVDVAADAPLYLAVLDAAGCGAEVLCLPPARAQHLDVTLPAGDFGLAVGSATGAAAAFTLDVALPPEVPNDACAGAITVVPPALVSGDTSWAQDDLSFPIAESCTGYFLDGADAFYSVAVAAGQVLRATATPAAAYDVALYFVDACAAPQCLAGSDAAFAGGPETATYTAAAAGTVLVVVDGASGGGGFTLDLR